MRRKLLAMTGAIMVMVAAPGAFAAPPQSEPGPGSPAPNGPATPQDAETATRDKARKIAEEGLSLFDSGRFAEALERFEQAGALVRAPTMGLMAARSLAKLGRLVEASEHYLAVTRMTLDEGASEAFRKAVVDAGSERDALQPRIPSLRLTVAGQAQSAAVTLDGKPVPAERLGTALPVDPGQHTVVVTLAGAGKTERLLLKEGEKRDLTLTPDVVSPPSGGGGGGLKIAGYTAIALGGVGVIIGVVSGGIAIATNSELAAECKPTCPNSLGDKNAGYETMKSITTPSLIVGAAVLGGGGLMLGLAPAPPKRASIQPFVGAGSAGVKVTF